MSWREPEYKIADENGNTITRIHVRDDIGKSGKPYEYYVVKDDGKYRQRMWARKCWEHHYGEPPPDDCIVAHVDGDNLNHAKDNLQLVARRGGRYPNKTIIVQCTHCGKKIRRTPSRVKGTHNFCNRQCRALYETENKNG